MTPFRPHKQGVSVNVRLTPGARREGFSGIADIGDGKAALKISVRAPPEDGRANAALIALLAKEWGLPKGAFSLLSGASSRQKTLLVEGDSGAVLQNIEIWLARKG
jgi:uncharacterized protein